MLGRGLEIYKQPETFGGFVGLLDQPFAQGATAAYSVRLLRADYTGGIIRVREDSGNNEQDFTAAEITDGTLASFCGSANGFVSTWYDQSGNGNNARNPTASNQPQIVDSGSVIQENGKPALDFDGSDDNFELDNSSTWSIIEFGKQFEFFIVNKADEGSGIIIEKANEWDFSIADNAQNNSKVSYRYGYFGDNTESANFNDEVPTSQVLTDLFGEGGVGVQADYNNNTYFDHSSTTTSSNDSNTTFKIGQRARNNTFPGKIQEIIYYETKKSNRGDIKDAINNFYSIY